MKAVKLLICGALMALVPVGASPFAAEPLDGLKKDSLRTGQIVLTESGGPISALMALIPRKFYPFSHAGIVVVEAGRAVVYEARGAYKIGPGTPADDWFEDRSGIRRLPIDEYLRREKYAVVYAPPPGVEPAEIAAFARRHYRAGTPFDSYFDDRTKDALYCAEFVHAALLAGGWQGVEPVPNRANPSLEKVLKWWGIRRPSTLPVGSLVRDSRYVGALGSAANRSEALIFNAFKAEIHRRFTADQKLGNVFKFSGDLKLRASVARLLRQARLDLGDEAAAGSFGAVRDSVKSLAEAMFGPVR